MRLKPTLKPMLALGALSILSVGATGCLPSGPRDCRADEICLWRHSNYGGGFIGTAHNQGLGRTEADYSNEEFTDGVGLNDDASSLANNTGNWVAFFRDNTYTGYAICVGPGKRHSNLANFTFGSPAFPSDMSDRLSSHKSYSSYPGNDNSGGPCHWTYNP